jgi:hypothetical protein
MANAEIRYPMHNRHNVDVTRSYAKDQEITQKEKLATPIGLSRESLEIVHKNTI